MVQELKEHRATQAESLLQLGIRSDIVFATSEGGPIYRRNLLKRHFKPLLKAAKLPDDLTLYCLRHSCATLLLQAGVHPKIVSERLGHASIVLTLDTYSHVLPTMQDEATTQISECFTADIAPVGSVKNHWHTIGTQIRKGRPKRTP